jgi:hypothetical protein
VRRRLSLAGPIFAGAFLVACKSPGLPQDHRPTDVSCPLSTPIAAAPCDAAAECPVVAHVACVSYDDAGTVSFCNADVCHVDSDCADGGVCLCGSDSTAITAATSNVCLAAGNCRVDSDCPKVPYCSPSSVGCGTTFSYYCHTPNDDCGSDADCLADQFCQYSPNAAKWTCVSAGACEGS